MVALMLLDFMHPSEPAATALQTATRYEASGSGQLTIAVEDELQLGSVARGATRVPFLVLNLSASCESDIKIQSLELRHTGLGSADDITSVYAVDGYTRVTRSAQFDRSGKTAILRFRSHVIPKCSATSLTIFADMSQDATVASEHGIALSGLHGIMSTAKETVLSSGDDKKTVVALPVTAGKLTARLLTISGPIRYGRIETVARLQLTADVKSAQLLKRITFTNDGRARDMDLQWFSLQKLSGTVLTRLAPRMRGYTITLDFSPMFILHAGQTIVLNLKAEVRGSQSKTVSFIIEEPSDIAASPYRER